MDQENVSATLTVAVPAARVFAVLADPTTHSAIDGTGWVQAASDRASLTKVGQIFRVDMYHPNHPDGNYQMANKVHVLDPPRAIGWLPGYRSDDGHLEFGGWIWRYDLAPLGPSETEVTLTYDWSAVPQSIREYLHFPPFGPEHLTNSLHHLAELAAPTSPASTPAEGGYDGVMTEVDTTAPTPRVLVIGLDPYRVPGPWDPRPVAEAIDVGIARFAEHGVGVETCLFGLDGSDDVEAVVAAALRSRPWECVVIGGGVRNEDQLELFERVLNLVRRYAPDAAIAFSSAPAETFDAAARWVDVPGPGSVS